MIKPKFHVEFKPFNATTPSLDFESSSKELHSTIDELFQYKQELLSLPDDQEGQTILVSLVYKVLYRFNILTRPSIQKSNSPKVLPEHENCLDIASITEENLYEISTHNFDHTLSNLQISKYHFLRGRLLNIFDSYNFRAEENLVISVKLDPRNFLAWTELGECYWKKGDLEAAQDCFKWILGIERDKQALTNLAMVQRRARKDRETLEESIKLCKEALSLDFSFSDAWVGIGASYMSMYFHVSRDLKHLKMALSAYDKADGGSTNPDLYQSKAIIYEYFENYEKAIENFQKASSLDAKLDSKAIVRSIKMFVNDMTSAIESRLNMNADLIEKTVNRLKLNSIVRNEVCLGEESSFNSNSIINLVVLCTAKRYHDAVGNSFIALDRNGHFCGLTILNLKTGIIRKSDILQVTAPVLIKFGEKNLPLIRVDSPYQVLLNGDRISSTQTAWVEMLVDTKIA